MIFSPEEKTWLILSAWSGFAPNQSEENLVTDGDGDSLQTAIVREAQVAIVLDLDAEASLVIRKGTDLRTTLRFLQKITRRLEASFQLWEDTTKKESLPDEVWDEVLRYMELLD